MIGLPYLEWMGLGQKTYYSTISTTTTKNNRNEKLASTKHETKFTESSL